MKEPRGRGCFLEASPARMQEARSARTGQGEPITFHRTVLRAAPRCLSRLHMTRHHKPSPGRLMDAWKIALLLTRHWNIMPGNFQNEQPWPWSRNKSDLCPRTSPSPKVTKHKLRWNHTHDAEGEANKMGRKKTGKKKEKRGGASGARHRSKYTTRPWGRFIIAAASRAKWSKYSSVIHFNCVLSRRAWATRLLEWRGAV